MKISFSATNPCHLLGLAAAVADQGGAGTYYSGYPAWKLQAPANLHVQTHALRTTVVYGALKFLSPRWRPSGRTLFRWQDHGFDRAVGCSLEPCDWVHAMPGQCLETFRAARKKGILTVLNHATGPVRQWVQIMEPEYRRVGLRLTDYCPYDADYFAREAEEYALSDWHCAASSVVRAQLVAEGIAPERIWQIPYGADTTIFHPPAAPVARDGFRIVFAGQAGLRKGIGTLLEALTLVGRPEWRADFYGAVLDESATDFAAYRGAVPLHFHGPVSQRDLADAFRAGSVLVLPSLEEGFGLVVPQALNCGLPCLVSDRAGAGDLLRHRQNGSVFPVGGSEKLAEELTWWARNSRQLSEEFRWTTPASMLIAYSSEALAHASHVCTPYP